jgi:hypothetical protein
VYSGYHTGDGIGDQDRETVGDGDSNRDFWAVCNKPVGVRPETRICFEKLGTTFWFLRQYKDVGSMYLFEASDRSGNHVLKMPIASGKPMSNSGEYPQVF